MDHSARTETILRRTIDEQNQRIETYQTKLRNVVQAYKDLQTEKAALEASLQALSAARLTEVTGVTECNALKKTPRPVVDESQETLAVQELSTPPENESPCDVEPGSEAEDQLRQQLATLTGSLAVVTQQKSKIESTFFAEKKKLKHEMEEREKQFHEEREGLLQQLQTLENDNQQWRNKLRAQQHEQEKEQSDYAVMLRELQKLVNTERIAREQIESQLEDARQSLLDRHQVQRQSTENHEKTVHDLHLELDELRTQLNAMKQQASEPSSLLVLLQKELVDVKAQEHSLIEAERERTTEVDVLLKQLREHSEERIAVLESKLTDFSEVISNTERQHTTDQLTIQKLRDRIIQLDVENTALLSAASNTTSSLEGADTQSIVERLIDLKEKLQTANEMAIKPISLWDALQLEDEVTTLGESLHEKCREQLENVKEEFERYKLRAQSVLKNKTYKDSSSEVEVTALKTQVSEFRERLGEVRGRYEQMVEKLKDSEESSTRKIQLLDESHRRQITSLDSEHRHRVQELEAETRRHRERTIAMLAEKDREVATLKAQLVPDLRYGVPDLRYSPQAVLYSTEPESSEVGASSEEASAISELLAHQTTLGGDPKLLHFAHERERKEVEIAALRRQKNNLELALRELKHDSVTNNETNTDLIARLREDIKKHQRDKTRENANLEYLKNVVYRYMVCHDGPGRQHIFNAISTILQFSPAEKQQVVTELAKGWWVYK